MIIDVHVHAFPGSIRAHRERYFEKEPAFALLYADPRARLAGAAEIVAAMDDQGVDKSVIFGFPWKTLDTARQNNDYVLEAVSRYPDRLIGFCCVDATLPRAADEVTRCLDGGMAGVGELAFYENGIDGDALSRLAPVMAVCEAADRPVLIHTNEPVGHAYPGKSPNTLAQIYGLAERFPRNRIVLAHWGGGIFFYCLLKKAVRAVLANVWVDTAASPFLYTPAVYRYAAELLGPEKILLGSDFPLIRPERYMKEMADAGLTGAAISGICGGNARSLLSL